MGFRCTVGLYNFSGPVQFLFTSMRLNNAHTAEDNSTPAQTTSTEMIMNTDLEKTEHY